MTKTVQILIAVWLVIAAFVCFLTVAVITGRQSTERQVRDQALSYARLVEQHASAALDRASSALLGVSDHLRPSDFSGGPISEARRREIEDLLVSQQQRAAGLISTFVARADGRIFAISLRAAPGTYIGDRVYFHRLKDNPGSGPVVSEIVYARVSKMWGAMVARRIDLPDGSFGGIIGANLGLTQNFSDFYSTLALGAHSTVSLRDADDRLLVRYPIAEERLGKQLAPGGILHQHMSAGDIEGTALATSIIDRTERIIGFRKLANYPVYAVVGLSLDDSLALWKYIRDMVGVACLLIILAGLFITHSLLRKQRAEAELRRANESLEVRVRDRTKELALANRRIVGVLEDERRRLARELHDRVSSNLTAIGLNIQNVETALSGEQWLDQRNTLSDCTALVADSAASARDISSDLHPSILDYMGLVPALRDAGDKFAQRTSIAVDVSGNTNGHRPGPDREIALYRIAQEALVNCAKHSKAGKVAISVAQDAHAIEMTIRDDGAGFRADAMETPGLGLLSMRERAEAVGGWCRIASSPGEGTRVTVRVPVAG